MSASSDASPASQAVAGVHVDICGALGPAEGDCAEVMIAAVLARHEMAADGARVRLSGSPCAGWPALVQVNLRVCGAAARVQVAGRSAAEVIAAGAARLQRQIRRLTTAWEPWPWPDPERRVLALPGEGQIVRVKSYRLYVGVPCQATAAMNAMDFDVYLFTDAETGEDAVIYRAGPTGLRLARQRSMHPPALPVTLPLTVNSRAIPTLTPEQAGHRLGEGWLPFLFFTNADSGRGNLIYRRYDGDLSLIVAAPADGRA